MLYAGAMVGCVNLPAKVFGQAGSSKEQPVIPGYDRCKGRHSGLPTILMSELSVQTRRLAGVASWHMAGANRARLAARAWTLVAFGTALLVFAITAAPDLTWAHGGYDGGELITASYTLGIPHPPGYPTYVLLGKLFSVLPAGTIAYRYHLFSALAVAVAVALLARTLMSSGERPLSPSAAAAAALGVALLPPVWSQATIAEVYGLNLAIVAATVFALLVLKRPFVTGICLGLALTTHATSLLLIPMALVLTPRTGWPRTAAGVVVGLLPLLLLPWLATTGSPVIWGDPTTVTGWSWLVSGRLYAANLAVPTLESLLVSPALFGSVMVALVATFVTVKARSNHASTAEKRDGLLTSLLALTAGAYAIFALVYRVPDADVFLLPAFLLLALAAAPLLGRAGRVAVVTACRPNRCRLEPKQPARRHDGAAAGRVCSGRSAERRHRIDSRRPDDFYVVVLPARRRPAPGCRAGRRESLCVRLVSYKAEPGHQLADGNSRR